MVNPILGCFISDENPCGHMTLALNWHTFALPVHICAHNAGGATVLASLTWGHAQAAQAFLSSGWGPRAPLLIPSLDFVTCPVGCSRRSPLRSVQSGCLEVSSLSIAECGLQGCYVGLSLHTLESLLCMRSPEVMSGCSAYPYFDDPADGSSVTTSYATGFAVCSLFPLGGRKT